MKSLTSFFVFTGAILLLAACEHTVSVETTVHPDGKLDKVIIFDGRDSSKNIAGIAGGSGWRKETALKSDKRDKGKDALWTVTWRKSFASADAANDDLDSQNDTLFHIKSTFEKRFRWFYTYIYYADTYRAVNRFQLPVQGYFTPEDYVFIDRLPAEGKKISKADSLYLQGLDQRIFDVYAERAVFEEYWENHVKLISDYKLPVYWADTLNRYKVKTLQLLKKKDDMEENAVLMLMDSLHIPLPYKQLDVKHPRFLKDVMSKITFTSVANQGRYLHKINMPWPVIRTNADSVIENHLLWKPPVTRFLLKDYIMFAESRTPNFWAFGITLLTLAVTLYLFFRFPSSGVGTPKVKANNPGKSQG